MSGLPRWLSVVVCVAALVEGRAAAADGGNFDRYNAEDINVVCSGCHGEFGQGGAGGTYPRLAGLPAAYIAEQLRNFKNRERKNIPMVPFATERELPEEDVLDIAGYLSSIRLKRYPPPPETEMDALERLRAAKKVVQIPRHPGDVAEGKRLYRGDCRLCHGNDGWGKSDTPQLAGQYSKYLRKQMHAFAAGEREHEDAEILFGELTEQDLDDLLAYLSTLDD
jgi:cytochrome c553